MPYVKGIFAIFDTEEQQFVQYKSKVAWASSGAAKAAWNLHDRTRNYTYKEGWWKGIFDDQSRFVIKNLLEKE